MTTVQSPWPVHYSGSESLLSKRSLSASVRRRESAADDRISVKIMGATGLVLTLAPFALVAVLDLLNYVQGHRPYAA